MFKFQVKIAGVTIVFQWWIRVPMKVGNDEIENVLEEGQGDTSQLNGDHTEQNMEQDVQRECPQETWHW